MTSVEWTPARYILFGEYCDAASIRRKLDAIRDELGATVSILLVAHGSTPVRSLFIVSGSDLKARRLEDGFLSVQYESRVRWGTVDMDARLDTVLAELDLPELSRRLTTALGAEARTRLLGLSSPGRSEPGDVDAPGASFVILSVLPTSRGTSAVLDKLLSELQCMVHAAVPIVARREAQRGLVLDQRVAEAIGASPVFKSKIETTTLDEFQSSLHQCAQSLLEATVALTASSRGHIYRGTSDDKSLQRVAAVGDDDAPALISLTEGSVWSYVYRTQRPVLLSDAAEYRRLCREHPPISRRRDRSDRYTQLLVPITQHNLDKPGTFVFGVMSVERDSDDEMHPYGEFDLGNLQRLALGFYTWYARTVAAHLAASVAELNDRTRHLLEAGTLPIPFEALKDGTPAEGTLAKPALEHPVQLAAELTRSLSVTLRLVTADRAHLKRLVWYPAEARESDQYDDIPLTEPCVTSSVARSGDEEYIPDVTKCPHYLEVHTGARSEFCLPILCDGQVLGTLNLESERIDGYDLEAQAWMRLIAEQISLVLWFARGFLDRPLSSLVGLTLAARHEAQKITDTLMDAVKNGHAIDPKLLQRLDAAISRAPLPENQPAELYSLMSMVENERRIQPTWTVPQPVDQQLSAPVRAHFYLAYGELLRNVPPGSKVELTAGIVTRAGQRFFQLHLSNDLPLAHVASSNIIRMYRTLIDDSRLRLGCITAAHLMRVVGGDVYVHNYRELLAKPPATRLVSAVEIPLGRANEA